jgi:hypothetical protein
MNRTSRRSALAVLAILLFAATASAELIVPVNGTGTGVFRFDQPSAVAYDSAAHVAFIGDADGSGACKLYYAAVDRDAPFRDADATQSDILRTAAVAIDNGSVYEDVRHPQIVARSSGKLIVVFQGVPTGSADGKYKLFRALITVANNAVTSQIVDEIVDSSSAELSGNLVDPSFVFTSYDDTLRIAYVDNDTSNVYYAKVGADNATVVGAPVLLSSLASSRGVQPLPRLKLDGDYCSHVVWAANNTSSTPTGIYYALVRNNGAGVQDNLAIGPTQVIYGNKRWGFPMLVVSNTKNIYVFGVNQPYGVTGTSGSVAVSRLNPREVTWDGEPVNVNNAAKLYEFFVTTPGGVVFSSNFDAYQPDVYKDSRGYFHIASYGYYNTSTSQGTASRYYVVSLDDLTDSDSSVSDPEIILYPLTVATGDESFGMQLDGDYTRAAFVHFDRKAFHFWSGPDNVTAGASNVYVTYSIDTSNSSGDSSGCSVAGNPPSGPAGRIPGAVALLLPAVLLLLRKAARKALARR